MRTVTVDVHVVDVSHPQSGDLVERARRLLDPVERERAQGFRTATLVSRFVLSHAGVRVLLGDRLGRPPESLRIAAHCPWCGADDHGKPYLDHETPVRFSLAHAEDMMMLAVCEDDDVGADIEVLDRVRAVDDLANMTLTDREKAHLAAQEGAGRIRTFLELWTVKEAYLKCSGLGLSVEPASVDALDLLDRGRAVMVPEDAGYVAAVAVGETMRADLRALTRHGRVV